MKHFCCLLSVICILLLSSCGESGSPSSSQSQSPTIVTESYPLLYVWRNNQAVNFSLLGIVSEGAIVPWEAEKYDSGEYNGFLDIGKSVTVFSSEGKSWKAEIETLGMAECLETEYLTQRKDEKAVSVHGTLKLEAVDMLDMIGELCFAGVQPNEAGNTGRILLGAESDIPPSDFIGLDCKIDLNADGITEQVFLSNGFLQIAGTSVGCAPQKTLDSDLTLEYGSFVPTQTANNFFVIDTQNRRYRLLGGTEKSQALQSTEAVSINGLKLSEASESLIILCLRELNFGANVSIVTQYPILGNDNVVDIYDKNEKILSVSAEPPAFYYNEYQGFVVEGNITDDLPVNDAVLFACNQNANITPREVVYGEKDGTITATTDVDNDNHTEVLSWQKGNEETSMGGIVEVAKSDGTGATFEYNLGEEYPPPDEMVLFDMDCDGVYELIFATKGNIANTFVFKYFDGLKNE